MLIIYISEIKETSERRIKNSLSIFDVLGFFFCTYVNIPVITTLRNMVYFPIGKFIIGVVFCLDFIISYITGTTNDVP